ncbi:MAG: Crp/Fnr family transcriptional regulator [Desulfobulbus sp.]|nr:MAG: Crp/Fnr family transcriptional regulator [Desulfobulbus sp.]
MKQKFSNINLLSELVKPENRDFFAEFSERTYPKNCLVSSPGCAKDQVFIVRQGRLRIYLAVEDKDFSLAILEPGDIYVTHTRAHVEALSETILLEMPTGCLHAHMATQPALSRTIISILGKLLSQSFSIIESLVFKDIRQRLTDFFLYEGQHNGTEVNGSLVFSLDLTTTQLAAIVGASRQTVSTIVSNMLKQGVLVKNSRTRYCIPHVDLLRNYPQDTP